ncbi:MAG: hypothetical protein AAGM67_00930 [Bacteroidota bacterium]
MARKKGVSLGTLAMEVGRRSASETQKDLADIIEFAESDWGLGLNLFPVQRVILKIYYGLELDNNDPYMQIPKDWRRDQITPMTEWEYFCHLYNEGRCSLNPKDYKVGQEKQELILSIGRRSGKTFITSCIAAYETYRLVMKGDPQAYYGLPPSNIIQLISIATDKDQAGLLYQEVSGHFNQCSFFDLYKANHTLSYAKFQTPSDIDKYGSYKDDDQAKSTIKVTFKSCVAKGLRGAGNIVIILDEAAHFTEGGQSSAEEVWQAVRPSASAYSQKDPNNSQEPIGPVESKIVLISSPLGRQGLFYKRFVMGMEGGEEGKNILSVQAPTWEVNPTIPPEEFESNYIQDVNVFFTEYGGIFSDKTSGWLKDDSDLMKIVSDRPRILSSVPRRPHFLGLDFALSNDASAMAIGHIENGKIHLDLVDKIQAGYGIYKDKERLEYLDVANWVYDVSRKFYIKEGVFDQWCGLIFEQTLHSRGLKQLKKVDFTKVLNSAMYKEFRSLMWNDKLDFYTPKDAPEGEYTYLEELMSLQAEYVSKYITKVEAPPGKHDDRADALARMIWIASQAMTRGDMGSHVSQNRRPGPANTMSPAAQRRVRRKALQSGSSPERQIRRRRRRR